MGTVMDEALRRAYLAAMDITVWMPRGEPDPSSEAVPVRLTPQARNPQSPPVSKPEPDRLVQPARAGRVQDTPDRPPEGPHRREARAEVSAARASFTFGFIRYGSTLLIDEEALVQRGAELACAICFAVERVKRAPDSQDFSWPPRGAPFVAAEARDAMLARIDKFGGDALARVLLLGEAPASVVMGWDAAQWVGRAVGVHRIEGLGCELVLLPGLRAMLGDPDAKRIAWQHLKAAGQSDG